jgi:hypothetical protein
MQRIDFTCLLQPEHQLPLHCIKQNKGHKSTSTLKHTKTRTSDMLELSNVAMEANKVGDMTRPPI